MLFVFLFEFVYRKRGADDSRASRFSAFSDFHLPPVQNIFSESFTSFPHHPCEESASSSSYETVPDLAEVSSPHKRQRSRENKNNSNSGPIGAGENKFQTSSRSTPLPPPPPAPFVDRVVQTNGRNALQLEENSLKVLKEGKQSFIFPKVSNSYKTAVKRGCPTSSSLALPPQEKRAQVQPLSIRDRSVGIDKSDAKRSRSQTSARGIGNFGGHIAGNFFLRPKHMPRHPSYMSSTAPDTAAAAEISATYSNIRGSTESNALEESTTKRSIEVSKL